MFTHTITQPILGFTATKIFNLTADMPDLSQRTKKSDNAFISA